MESTSLSWLWWLVNAVVCCVGTAVVVRRLLIPWSYWLGRRALCCCRYALFHGRGDVKPGQRRAPPACRCCGGVNFDGMVGSWAVVTGCTDGIGKEYAMQLADRGMNVALVSRNLHKLLDVAYLIDERHAGRVKTKIVVADFTSSSGTVPLSGTYDSVRRGLARLDVRLLVNNAGVAYARPERLLDLASCCTGTLPDPCRDVVECNALATVAMCRIVMPLMVVDGKDGKDSDDDRVGEDAEGDYWQRLDDAEYTSPKRGGGGVVINVSSASAKLPCPLLSVYAATKAFVEKFSVELAAEYDEENSEHQIAVRCLTPGFVATKMSRIRPTSTGDTGWTYAPSPRSYASHSLRALDCNCLCGLKLRERVQMNRNGVGEGGKADEPGWLARVFSIIFDSPSSPLSAGRSGVTTAGYPSHTLMLMAVNVVRWLFGDQYLSSAAGRMMCGMRNRMMNRDSANMQNQTSKAEFENQSHESGSHN